MLIGAAVAGVVFGHVVFAYEPSSSGGAEDPGEPDHVRASPLESFVADEQGLGRLLDDRGVRPGRGNAE